LEVLVQPEQPALLDQSALLVSKELQGHQVNPDLQEPLDLQEELVVPGLVERMAGKVRMFTCYKCS